MRKHTSPFSFTYQLIYVALFMLATAISPIGADASVDTKILRLTPEERAWLEAHPEITIAFDGDYAPYSYTNNLGEFKGIAVDFATEIATRIGLKFKPYPDGTWKNLYAAAQNRQVDVIATLTKRPERVQWFEFTEPYLHLTQYVLTRKGESVIQRREDVAGKTLALVEKYAITKYLLEEFPTVTPYYVNSVTDALEAVAAGKTDGTVAPMGTSQHIIARTGMQNLQFAVLFASGLSEQRFGVRNDWPELRSILDKALASITAEERQQIFLRWTTLNVAQAEAVAPATTHLPFTSEERAWLAKHTKINLGVDPSWPPFEFIDKNSNYAGISSGFIDAITDRLNITMTPEPGLTWSQVIEKAKAGEIDVLPAVIRTREREKYLNFTKPYISFPIVTATNKNTPFISSIKDLSGYRVGVVKDYYAEDVLRNDHPYLKLVTYVTLAEGLQELDAGHIDAFIDNMVTITQEIDRSGLENTRISVPTSYAVDLSLGVRKDLPELVGILNKVLDSISNREKATIKSSWMTDVEVKIRFDYKGILAWAIPIGGSALLIIGFVVVWNRRLGREIAERKQTEEALRESRAAARGLLDATQESLMLLDSDGTIIAANQTAGQRLQQNPEQLNGSNLFALLPQDLSESRKSKFERVLRTGSAAYFEDTLDSTIFQNNYFPVHAKTGEVTAVAIFAQDITDRKLAEEKLRQNMEELERFSKMAVGREERMIELKKEINGLLKELGQQDKYKIVVDE